jgi:hypothetical protein
MCGGKFGQIVKLSASCMHQVSLASEYRRASSRSAGQTYFSVIPPSTTSSIPVT